MSSFQGYLVQIFSMIYNCNAILLICFFTVILPSVSSKRPVFTKPTSFSNYYAKVNKNSDPFFTYGNFAQTPTPVSIPENVLQEYLLPPQLKYKQRVTKKNGRKENDALENEIEQSHGWGWPSKTKEKEVDTTLDDLTGVMGPAFFLIPFVVKLIPFAIPAIPLSHILNNYAPASIPELVTRLQEIYTQITEFIQQTAEAAGAGAEG
ncbi:unnamed protein product [Orchesella dallaii]|uniref:Uncharacterized protein n=1 Tax=Orchesella dallaii TaxID=48710 RepID=A0ABP1QJ96_9HEXA